MTASAPTPGTAEIATASRSRHPPVPLSIVAAGVLFGLVCGAFEITNTSIGWHIAAGRWMLEHREVLDHDPFSFTSGGVEWIDHEWLFQIIVAGLFDLGGAPLLVAMRMLLVAVLMILLIRISVSSGLDPPVALVLAALCVIGARPRFFLRPELVTLVLLPLAVWLFSDRDGRRWWPLSLVAVIALGVNLHGAILVAPILISVWFAGEVTGQVLDHNLDRGRLLSGAVGVIVAAAAPLLNPHGASIWTVPFKLTEMVRLPHIPNPEWISPTPSDAPALYLAMLVALVALGLGSRTPQHWFASAATAALALKHIRNIGLFFVLLPLSVAPALARWPAWTTKPHGGTSRRRLRSTLCLLLIATLAFAAALRPWPRAGFGFADRWYPQRALEFMADNDLRRGRLYNDVRFGGWLTLQGSPGTQIFIDDRNEIHEPLLKEIWEIFSRSDVAAWEALLSRWQIDTVLLRYHEPLRVATPAGEDLGRRGFSTLWFPTERWATVYWDDVAIVLVRRSSVPESFLAEREYRHLNPDDLEHMVLALNSDLELRRAVATELQQ
ncbi:MAG: hypothetical protein V2I67_17630, partial [Thermoanaerobaculales bacterium]|nr:hypothetical protein [Thermoanaerobaculales bacterium]